MNRFVCPLVLALAGLVFSTANAGTRDLFLNDEAHLDMFATYVNHTPQQWGGGLGLDTFYGKYFGVGIVTHMENFTGTFIDNLAAEVTVRMPIEKFHLAPYLTGSYGYEFDQKDWFQSVGAGAEFRFSSTWGIFADYQWVFRHGGNENGDYVRLGLRIAL